VPTHEEQSKTLKIAKGTLIVVDINTADYLGRNSLPKHFCPDNRVNVSPLITNSKDIKVI
jgi:hypothetical protein